MISLQNLFVNWDSRTKLLSIVVSICSIALYTPLESPGVLYLFVFSLIFLLESATRRFFKKVLLPITPVLLLFLFTPIITNYLVGGTPNYSQNLLFGFLITLKSLSILCLSLFLFHSSTISEILSSLKYFRIPLRIIFIFMTTFRYFFLFTRMTRDIIHARSLRLFNSSHLTNISSTIRILLEKAFYHAEEVFVAMRLRGGENRLPLLYPLEFKYSDFALTGCVFIVVLIPHVAF